MNRRVFSLVLALLLAACGGGGSATTTAGGGTDDTTGGAPATTSGAPGTTIGGTGTTVQSGGGAGGTGQGSLNYTISGGFDAEGEAPYFSGMSFYSDGIWNLAFGDGTLLILVYIDPSTPSINFTDGANTVSGSDVECDFDFTRQDESGADGSYDCQDAPAVVNGTLTTASMSGDFTANP